MEKLSEARRALAAAHWENARRMAAGMGRRRFRAFGRVNPDDVATDGLIRAARAAAPGDTCIDTRFLNHCVKFAWVDAVRLAYGRKGLKTRRPPVLSLDAVVRNADPDRGDVDPVAAGETVEAPALYADLVESLGRKLPPMMRRAFLRRYLYPGLSLDGGLEATTHTHVSHARDRLREIFECPDGLYGEGVPRAE